MPRYVKQKLEFVLKLKFLFSQNEPNKREINRIISKQLAFKEEIVEHLKIFVNDHESLPMKLYLNGSQDSSDKLSRRLIDVVNGVLVGEEKVVT